MLKLTRLFMLIAVALVATQPVMACCLTGHADAVAAQSSTETPPCHGEKSHSDHGKTDQANHLPSPTECPGCLDCDTAVMQAQSFDSGVLLTKDSQETPLTISSARFDGFEHKTMVFTTGPPGDLPVHRPTPITLKQRLLI